MPTKVATRPDDGEYAVESFVRGDLGLDLTSDHLQ